MRSAIYQPSGRMGAFAIPAAFIVGGGAAIAMAFVYQKLLDWIPFIYLNVLIVIGFGFAIGFVTAFGLACITREARDVMTPSGAQI